MKRARGDGSWVVIAAGALAAGAVAVAVAAHTPAALADGAARPQVGVACQTATSVCAVADPSVGAPCSCARVSDGTPEQGLVLPDLRGG